MKFASIQWLSKNIGVLRVHPEIYRDYNISCTIKRRHSVLKIYGLTSKIETSDWKAIKLKLQEIGIKRVVWKRWKDYLSRIVRVNI